jgi:hypothetical protein
MSNDLIKRTGPTAPKQAEDASSRLKQELMSDALGCMFGEDGEKPGVAGTPRVILALANHGRSPGWDRAKVLQGQMFAAAGGSGLEMKFAFYGPDDAAGVRRCRITTRWITDPDDMAASMDKYETIGHAGVRAAVRLPDRNRPCCGPCGAPDWPGRRMSAYRIR